MTPRQVAEKYFSEERVMQLATLRNGKPRVCSVYFVVSDDQRAVYWMSEPRRRHSGDIQNNPHVAGTIVAKMDQPVAGLQFTGLACEVSEIDEVTEISRKYSEKYPGESEGFSKRFAAGKNRHRLYKITIDQLDLFDEVNFPVGEVVDVPFR